MNIEGLNTIVQKSIGGSALSPEEALAVLSWPDAGVLTLVQAVSQVRQHFFQNKVKLHFLMNIQSGMCAEDCSYCSQSRDSHAEVQSYRMLQAEDILPAARQAVENGASKLCLVASMRGPSQRDLEALTQSIRTVKSLYPDLGICASLGILSEGQAEQLKAAGVTTYNHNLNTSEEHYQDICTTHTYSDRVNTVQYAQKAGLLTCSGAIFGMGEKDEDIIEIAFRLRELDTYSIPVNFLIPIEGTPLSEVQELTPQRCLKILALFRLINPSSEIRVAAGRELHLRSMQPLSLYIANSLFIGDYLTTKGQAIAEDLRMIRDYGFEVEGMPLDFLEQRLADEVEMIGSGGGCACGGSCGCHS